MPIEVTGLDELVSSFEEIKTSVPKAVSEVIGEIAVAFVDTAQGRAPVLTGYLRDNIQITEQDDVHAVITSQADYSIYVEEGTYKMSAQPFMMNTAAEIEQDFHSELSSRISMAISETFR